jgi:cob(I)alamin adenosyltransferase
MTPKQIDDEQKELNQWYETKVGAAFKKFRALAAIAWTTDSNPRAAQSDLSQARTQARAAERELINAIKELQR